jgi:hypothetical protein
VIAGPAHSDRTEQPPRRGRWPKTAPAQGIHHRRGHAMTTLATSAAATITAAASPAGTGVPRGRRMYLAVLTWAFTLFSSVRVAAYLPTLWAISTSGDSSQHSLWTWLTWLGANATMAAWLHEKNGGRFDRAVAVNVCNALMCLCTVLLIVAFRFG